MADLLVRNVRGEALASLREAAERDGRSLEAEVRTILDDELRRPRRDAAIARIDAIYERLSSGGRTYSDSTLMIRADRDSR